jgi:sec-independent protein translocase protein TatC
MEEKTLGKNFWDHFNDLKMVLIRLTLTWSVFTAGSFFFSEQLFDLVTRPLNGQTLKALSPTEPFMLIIKIHAVAGLIISFPILLIFIWNYLSKVFLEKEKKFIIFYTLSTLFLAMVGVVYAYFSLIPSSLRILLDIAPKGVEVDLTTTEYLNFFLSLLFSLILVFQTPIAVFGLIRSGIITAQSFYKKRREVYLAIIIVMAILTPTPDIFSLVLIILPVIFLLEISVFFASKKTTLKDLPKNKNSDIIKNNKTKQT